MMKKLFSVIIGSLLILKSSFAQNLPDNIAKGWVDSVYNSLSDDERIAQLMVLRLSTIDGKTKMPVFFDDKVMELVKKYNIGGVCLFQGSPVKQATIINALQAAAKTPILMCIDAEWGVGMRMTDSVAPLPHQMMLGAVQDENLIYQYGKTVAEQCKRIGIQVNYAPVVDINNNPNNPVINDRSFGEDKYKVANYGIQYMQGMQDVGVMACAKHFPGHGDVAVDSHFGLPVIHKSITQLDSLELYPFRKIFNAGIGSAMVAHLYIPAIDSTPNRATSISKNNVTGLLRNELGYQGLTFTDALDMQGVKKFFPNGEASAQSIIAGNDMLCLPEDVPLSIEKIKNAITAGKLTWADIEEHCKKVLMAKYQYGLTHLQPINTENLTADLNKNIGQTRRIIAENAITLLRKTNDKFFPLAVAANKDDDATVLVCIGSANENAFARRIHADYNADVFYFNYQEDATRILSTVELIHKRYKNVIISIHNYKRVPANNFGISRAVADLATQLQQQTNAVTFIFGNPYAIKNWCNAPNLVVCYEDDSLTQHAAIDMLEGKLPFKGKLPVTVCDSLKYGSGIITTIPCLQEVSPTVVGLDSVKLNKIDSIANEAISQKATPGCVVLVTKDGKIAYQKGFGYLTYDDKEPVTRNTVYDMASVTKVCATSLAVMKLYEEGKIGLSKKLADYLPWVKGSDKESITIENLLLHQAGLVPFISFYKETTDRVGIPNAKYYRHERDDSFSIVVAHNLYLRNDWRDTMYKRIVESSLEKPGKYIYSDNDFIFLQKVVEAITGISLDEYVSKEFYQPMGLTTAGFNPLQRMSTSNIAPTEQEKQFRRQLIQGYVHDPGAAMFGGVSGHAGLFSDAYDVAAIMQMLLNGGLLNGKQYLNKETIKLFTSYHSKVSRRGYGFDKPEKDNDKRKEPYPCKSASPLTFGHTGFTGTCVWADPANDIVFIFLSNRIMPDADNTKLSKLNVRGNIQELIYQAIIK